MTDKNHRPLRKFQRCYYVYLLSSLRGVLYVGLTDDLRKRMLQHKAGTFDGFTKRYRINRLMCFETYTDPQLAERREQQIKKYRREKKIALFKAGNPQWKDLTPEIFQGIGYLQSRSANVPVDRGDRSDDMDPSLRSGFQKEASSS